MLNSTYPGLIIITVPKKPITNALITSYNKKQAFKRISNGKEAAKSLLKILKKF